MPFEVMDQRGLSASPHFFEEICFHSEIKAGRKVKPVHDHQGIDGMAALPGSILNAPSPSAMSTQRGMQLPSENLPGDFMEKLHVGGEEGSTNMMEASNNFLSSHPKSWSNVSMQQASASDGLIGNKIVVNAAPHESSLFSSSLSDLFSRKLRLVGNGILSDHPSRIIVSHHEEEPYESLEDIEAETIGNLLPDEEDLFSGVIDELGYNAYASTGNDFEDFDLFSSGGGMELEGDDHLSSGKRNYDLGGVSSCHEGSNGKHPFGEHPSRTLFVRNINSNVEDSELKALFEQYGDIRTLYTACKHRGFVMVSYYDLRAAQNAMRGLQSRLLRHRKLDIHYSIPKGNPPEKDINYGTLVLSSLDSSVSNDELQQIFGFYGEIREICETPEEHHKRYIEFYDVRATEAALRALNRSDIAGKQIKLELGNPVAATSCCMQQSQKEQDEPNICHSIRDNSSSGHMAISSGVISSGCSDNGTNQGLHFAMQQPTNTFIENAFHRNSSVSNNLPSPLRLASAGKLLGVSESNNFNDGRKFSSIPSLHPHSFPEYHDSLANGITYNSSSTIEDVASSIGLGMTEVVDHRHIRGITSTRNLMELNGGGFGSSKNRSSPLYGFPYMWNNSNYQQHPSVILQNSPFVNGACAPRLPQMPGFPRTPPHMLRGSHIDNLVGSAPAVNPSPWGRQHAYPGESPEASSFRWGSLGSAGLPGTWQLHPADVSPHDMLPHVGGNCLEMTSNAVKSSPKQMCHIFSGRNAMTMPKFDFTNERGRNLYHRRNEANANNADRKQYELDIDRILLGEDNRTTLMIKNIPNKYTSKMLLAAIDELCRGTYDFIYLPIDFKNKCNVGYAFINMIDPGQIVPFYQAFNGKKWEKFNSEKVASLAYARIQGKSALIAHFQNSSLMNEDKRCRPILFHTDGPNAGDPEPFPMGTNIRSRPGKSRTFGFEEQYSQGNSSTSANGEDSTNGIDSSLGFSNNSD
ncbi:protein MEI2-like 1 [Quillaja saponaria]|uniref:Protein MEI2-like 1 n=1 Tax=Quillaja saponaria TaxID=32244 RepID=A0AAD7KTU1_QUISA|nr:protein MEI2-like 1 [Quillaja saponaria]